MRKIIITILILIIAFTNSCFAITKDDMELLGGAKFGMSAAEITYEAGELGYSDVVFYAGPGDGVNWSSIMDRAEACGRSNPIYLSVWDAEYAGYEASADYYFDDNDAMFSTCISFRKGEDDREDKEVYTEQFDVVETMLVEEYGLGEPSETKIDMYPRTFVENLGDLKQIPYIYTTRFVELEDGSMLYVEHYIYEHKTDYVSYYKHILGFTVFE